jgi:hypothetical protein
VTRRVTLARYAFTAMTLPEQQSASEERSRMNSEGDFINPGSQQSLVDTSVVKDCFAEYKNRRSEHGKSLRSVYVFVRWHNQLRRRDII